ncbi:hypothetical protein K2173_025810 [Erythroxylum novogranatense]|uniref:Transcription initiation factor TFIID subunit 8 n=1 Tax=Erythroxylum novogranatense TaxID=1862640 RepID=A0AAV8SI19_9ROSI|nr:hypothetical protein K2173_025810 [Erythroxylum novogranatense]
MSHGGGENGPIHQNLHLSKRKSSEFPHAIAEIAVAQICESAGFQAFQQSALDTLSDVTLHYIHSLGKTAHFFANLSGRTEVNAFDVIQGLEELGSSQGFAAASDIDHCLASSGTIKEIVQFVGVAEVIPFAYSLPSFPAVRERKLAASFLQIGKEPPGDHIPPWLPAFPDQQTYLQLPTGNEEASDMVQKIELSKQHGKTGRFVLNLQQHYNCNGSEGSSSVAVVTSVKAKEVGESNPFLAAPLQSGDKEVSHMTLPSKFANDTAVRNLTEENVFVDNPVSVMGTFAPAIEAIKGRFSDSEEKKNALPNQRTTVQFKLGIGRRPVTTALDLKAPKKGMEKVWLCSADENEKDDKKKRAEKILKQSMENPEELAQL